MYHAVLELHSYIAYAVLVFLVLAILNSFVGLSSKRAFIPRDRQIAMIALIFTHVQFVLGLLVLFTNARLEAVKQLGMGGLMKNGPLRLLFVEHPTINLIAIVLITIGWSKHKRAGESERKFKSIAIFYLIGLVLLLSRIPYGQWFD
jgi:cytochrome bd-type quinol oxidase subunit 2